jgi:type IV pilus assembly protein PilA
MNMMLKRQLELKKKNGKKGFTLIEVIVVIVILAILAAIAVPALTGYIDKARDKGLEADGHNIMVALQSIGTDIYAAQEDFPAAAVAGSANIPGVTPVKTFSEEIDTLTGNTYDGTLTGINYTSSTGKLTHFEYTPTGTDAKTVIFDDGGFTIS